MVEEKRDKEGRRGQDGWLTGPSEEQQQQQRVRSSRNHDEDTTGISTNGRHLPSEHWTSGLFSQVKLIKQPAPTKLPTHLSAYLIPASSLAPTDSLPPSLFCSPASLPLSTPHPLAHVTAPHRRNHLLHRKNVAFRCCRLADADDSHCLSRHSCGLARRLFQPLPLAQGRVGRVARALVPSARPAQRLPVAAAPGGAKGPG